MNDELSPVEVLAGDFFYREIRWLSSDERSEECIETTSKQNNFC